MTVRPPGAVAASAASKARALPAASTTTSHLTSARRELGWVEDGGRPELARVVALRRDSVDRHDVPAAQRDRGEQGGHAHPTEPDDHDALAGLGWRGIEEGAAAREHCASEHRGHVWRHVVIDGDDRSGVHHSMGGKCGHPEVVMQRVSVAGQPASSTQELTGAVAG